MARKRNAPARVPDWARMKFQVNPRSLPTANRASRGPESWCPSSSITRKPANRREEISRQYPTLKLGDVQAAVGYAAWLAHEEDEHPLHAVGKLMAKRRKTVAMPQPCIGGYDEFGDEAFRALLEASAPVRQPNAINNILTATYREIGRRIVEHEQGGQARAGIRREIAAATGRRFDSPFRTRFLKARAPENACVFRRVGDLPDTVGHVTGSGQVARRAAVDDGLNLPDAVERITDWADIVCQISVATSGPLPAGVVTI